MLRVNVRSISSRFAQKGSYGFQLQASRKLHGLRVGVAHESGALEKRVALVPANVEALVKKGAAVEVAPGCGAESGFPDATYAAAGATVASSPDAVWANDVVVKVTPPTMEEVKMLGDRTIIAPLAPAQNPDLIDALASQGATALSMDMLLRTLSRGQAFDVLSSQANVAGYRAVIEAASVMQRPFAGQTTAAGRIQPMKCMVVGAGVAGLAAIQAAKQLGAVVTALMRARLQRSKSKPWAPNFSTLTLPKMARRGRVRQGNVQRVVRGGR